MQPKSDTIPEADAIPANGSLTRHDHGCRCWPHVSEADAIEAVVQAATAEYRESRAALAADDSPSEGLTQSALETVVHILGCPRWNTMSPDECVYRDIHVEDAAKRGSALRAALTDPSRG